MAENNNNDGALTEILDVLTERNPDQHQALPKKQFITSKMITLVIVVIITFLGGNATVDSIINGIREGIEASPLSQVVEDIDHLKELSYLDSESGFTDADRQLLTATHSAAVGYHEDTIVKALHSSTTYEETLAAIQFWYDQDPVWSGIIQSALSSMSTESGRESMNRKLPSYQAAALRDWYSELSGDEK